LYLYHYHYGDAVKVMERLMSISSDYWSTFINIDTDGTRDFGTPRLSEGNRHIWLPILLLEIVLVIAGWLWGAQCEGAGRPCATVLFQKYTYICLSVKSY